MQFQIEDLQEFKKQALKWADGFEICAVYDSNGYTDQYGRYDLMIAAGFKRKLQSAIGHAFADLQDFMDQQKGWLFGGLAYDLKNETENLDSAHPDGIQFPDLFFFEPEHLLLLKAETLEVISDEPEKVWAAIQKTDLQEKREFKPPERVDCRFSKKDYLHAVQFLQDQIFKGNIYEVNFCIEFFVENYPAEALQIFEKLLKVSPTPFATYFKWHDRYLMGASPERFLAKKGQKLISQPIKGTARRHSDPAEDEKVKMNLYSDPKERQENVMIVDLVRNDLTRSAKKGTVKVEELFGIYTFKQVHQMISTVVCETRPDLSIAEILKRSFPMGSMTGAPKIKVMQLIESAERTKRGIYSGAVGYIDPEGDFDFNVVIRSLLYNKSRSYLSFQAGSAITYSADAEKEYEECLVKISGIMEALGFKG